MHFRFSYFLITCFITLALFNSSCKKDKLLTTGGELKFSTDTLAFDTVFTQQLSFTARFKIYNPQNQKISVSSVRMANGTKSYFKLNVDGYSDSAKIPAIDIAPHDSIYVFVTLLRPATTDNAPFIIEDQFIANMNGKEYSLPFTAYGQNAYYINAQALGTQTLHTDKPYVIIHSALVDTNQTLTIPAGCRIYMHADSRLYVAGTLKIMGTKTDSVIFQGDRLDRAYFGYEGYPGEWGGIYFYPISKNNELHYTIISNGGNASGGGYAAALWADMDDDTREGAQVFLDHTIINNSIGYGILGRGANITAENCLVHTCGAEALALAQGGTYNFKNCSFAIYGNDKVSHIQEPTALIVNYRQIDDDHYVANDLNATLTNCLIYGSLDNELLCDKKPDNAYNLTLDHCLIKSKDALGSFVTQQSCKFNEDPQFEDYSKFDFHLKDGSAAVNAGGTVTLTTATDLDDKPRYNGAIDIGCYERQ